MTREQKMQAVVDAAKILADSAGVIWGRTPEDADTYTHEREHGRDLLAAIAALDAHTEAEAQEVVTLAVWKDTDDGEVRFVDPDGTLHEALSRVGNYRRTGTVTLPLTREAGR